MPNTVQCEIVTLASRLFESEAVSVAVPGSEGEMGILARHVPLVATLKPGEVRITDETGDVTSFAVLGGYVQVQPGSKVIVLADKAVRVDEIEKEALAGQKTELEQKLAGLDEDAPERAYLISELTWNSLLQGLSSRS